jgi:hypothetical protein
MGDLGGRNFLKHIRQERVYEIASNEGLKALSKTIYLCLWLELQLRNQKHQ